MSISFIFSFRHLKIGAELAIVDPAVTVNGVKVFGAPNLGSATVAKINFECRYPSLLELSGSDPFTVGTLFTSTSTAGYGSLLSQFQLDVFKNANLAQPIGPETLLFIGNQIYVAVTFQLNTEIVEFFVQECFVTNGEHKVFMVKVSGLLNLRFFATQATKLL